jgi:hypothetical protein
MKWLKLDKKEKRTESLTVRLSESSVAKLEKLITYLEKKYGKASQADLIEQLIDVAYEEMLKGR